MNELITKSNIFVKDEEGQMVVAHSALERIAEIETEKKRLDKEYKKYRKVLQEGMEEYGIKKVDTDDVLITYIEPTEKLAINQKKLWAEYKDIAFKCQEFSPVKASIKITVR